MKILHTADWHIGSFKGPEENGVNLCSEDTIRCLEEMVRVAAEEKPELVLVAGDIFDRAEIWQGRSHKEVLQARNIILKLSDIAPKVIVMRGTPNHDSDGAFEELQAHFEFFDNVDIVTTPQVIKWENCSIAVLPGFDRGVFRSKFPGLGKEEENEVMTKELGNIVAGLRAMCNPEDIKILMSHYTVPGCNTESGQTMMLTQFEPILPTEALNAANYDLVALGHIHRPQCLSSVANAYYSGAINAMNFNDEGQERGFWIHNQMPFGWSSELHKTPYREFMTIHLNDDDIGLINAGDYDLVGTQHWRSEIEGKIVRVLYSCSYENNKALNKAVFEKELLDDGAFYVKEIVPEKISEMADRQNLHGTTDPEENLKKYLEEKQLYSEEKIQELILKARPVIAEAEASISMSAAIGTFEPVEIAVKNYRNYEEEKFSFEDISFCTINGQNGAGKSSLFMDAIIDCLYEEPREGDLTGWIRNDEKARSGSIMFTFKIGEKMFRVTRTRARSGKGTLNLSEYVDSDWVDRSKEKYKDTQNEIINILGMDSLTFKSCALIMQDQYGLFLQAPKEDRMVILGNLLGLGVYQAMEKIAWDKARVFGAKMRELKQEITIHKSTIDSYGNPLGEIDAKKTELDSKSQLASEHTKDRDSKKVELLSMQEAKERCDRISTSISLLTQKKAAVEANKAQQASIMASCKGILDMENSILEKADRYRALEIRKKELIEGTALYSSKMLEISRTNSSISAIESDIAQGKLKLQTEQSRLAVYEDTSGDEEAKEKASEYLEKKKELDSMQEKAVAFQKAKTEHSGAVFHRDAVVRQFDTEKATLEKEKKVLENKVAILSESGCVDIDNAHCKFLQDAIEARDKLALMDGLFVDVAARRDTELAKAELEVSAKYEDMQNTGYDAAEMSVLQQECAKLYPFVAKAELAKKKENEIALIRASIENIQSNILDNEKRLATAKLEAERAQSELEQYRGAFEENTKVEEELKALATWIDQEKQLPVVKERNANAVQRLSELELQGFEYDSEIIEKQQELSVETLKTTGLSEKKAEVERIDMVLNGINQEIKDLQMEIGALKQKAEETKKLELEIEKLREQENEAAKETADYDTLKAAFSQDGIPHQIIRTIIPQLTETANTILGQMTGGKMGLEFKTEKTMKSNSKKEVVTLDIFIEEYGKSTLPYLSKSGGEKVKSSLSVILALAEIKSSSAGIQLGMLFIDEPPFLDGDGIQAYCDALETIQRRYSNIKIMAITHDPTMKARFPQNLDVVKTEHGSKVIY